MTPELDVLAARALALRGDGGRALLGVAGAPGAGKSTFAAALVAAVGALRPGHAALVPMDGWHLRHALLVERGAAGRKGAPDTFDVEGFTGLLSRLRAGIDVAVPAFDRALDDVVPNALVVPASVPLVVVEGNYLLLDDGPWAGVRPLLDEVWFVAVDERTRHERLVRRHVAGGRTPAAARAFVDRSDEVNAALVATTARHADLVVRS